uniref:HL07910p n=1 Tax=Drosophila melanogaster TaxID=7227 RepID=Q8MRJ6_DROME|nr:HL07910p [Drosophila melanogaster]
MGPTFVFSLRNQAIVACGSISIPWGFIHYFVIRRRRLPGSSGLSDPSAMNRPTPPSLFALPSALFPELWRFFVSGLFRISQAIHDLKLKAHDSHFGVH